MQYYNRGPDWSLPRRLDRALSSLPSRGFGDEEGGGEGGGMDDDARGRRERADPAGDGAGGRTGEMLRRLLSDYSDAEHQSRRGKRGGSSPSLPERFLRSGRSRSERSGGLRGGVLLGWARAASSSADAGVPRDEGEGEGGGLDLEEEERRRRGRRRGRDEAEGGFATAEAAADSSSSEGASSAGRRRFADAARECGFAVFWAAGVAIAAAVMALHRDSPVTIIAMSILMCNCCCALLRRAALRRKKGVLDEERGRLASRLRALRRENASITADFGRLRSHTNALGATEEGEPPEEAARTDAAKGSERLAALARENQLAVEEIERYIRRLAVQAILASALGRRDRDDVLDDDDEEAAGIAAADRIAEWRRRDDAPGAPRSGDEEKAKEVARVLRRIRSEGEGGKRLSRAGSVELVRLCKGILDGDVNVAVLSWILPGQFRGMQPIPCRHEVETNK